MSLPVITTMKGVKGKKWIKKKVGVGFAVEAKVREVEETTREGRIRRVRKEVVGCVQDVVGRNKFVVKFEYGYNIDTSASSLSYVREK